MTLVKTEPCTYCGHDPCDCTLRFGPVLQAGIDALPSPRLDDIPAPKIGARPRLLDLFCCEGGASRGYEQAGFDVVGVDLFKHTDDKGRAAGYSQARYPFESHQADAIEYALAHGHEYDAIHASPPCQAYSIATAGNPVARAGHTRLIAATRDALQRTGRPYVIENVERAAHLGEIRDPVLLCGRMFGLEADDVDGARLLLDRHRVFETNFPLTAPPHRPHGDEQVAGVYGGGRRAKRQPGETLAEVAPRDRHAAKYERQGGYVPRSKEVLQQLLGVDWMTVGGMQECIPPVYTQFIGLQLRAALLTDSGVAA